MEDVVLVPLMREDREQFILDNQEAFNYGALEEFGRRDDHFEEEGEIISRETIERSIDGGEAYRILWGGKKVGGAVISVRGDRGELELLFVSPKEHSKGIGYAAWCAIERMHPEVRVWETVTPCFEKRNVHFYVNRCGFRIVEYFNRFHPDPNDPENGGENSLDGLFRFEKRIGQPGEAPENGGGTAAPGRGRRLDWLLIPHILIVLWAVCFVCVLRSGSGPIVGLFAPGQIASLFIAAPLAAVSLAARAKNRFGRGVSVWILALSVLDLCIAAANWIVLILIVVNMK